MTPLWPHSTKATPPTLAGFFFCLASAEDARLLFCTVAIQPHTSVYSVFHAVNASYTAHAAKQRTGLYSGFSCNLPCFCACYLAVHPAMLYSLQGAGGHTDERNVFTDTRYRRHAGRCTGQHRRPIIIMYIRAQHIADHASPAGSASPPV